MMIIREFRTGVSLLEIMAAMLILAFAFIPIIGVIGTGSSDTDVTNSYVFAQTAARNIMDMILDDVPFDAIRTAQATVEDIGEANHEANVGEIFELNAPVPYDPASFAAAIGNDTGDNYARGRLTDDRGNIYKIKIFVFPIPVSNPVNPDTDVTFRLLPRYKYEDQVAGDNNIWYSETSDYVGIQAQRPYDYVYSPGDISTQGAVEVGATPNAAGDFCLMRRILLRIKWTMPKGGERQLELYSAKANLAPRDFL